MKNKSFQRIRICVKKSSTYRKFISLLKWFQEYHDGLEIILIIITIIVATWLLCATQEQVEQSRKQVCESRRTNKIADESLQSQKKMSDRSIALSQSIASTQDSSMKIQNRAYVMIDSVTRPVLEIGEHIKWDIRYINMGNTPANHVRDIMKPKIGGTSMYEHEIRNFEKKRLINYKQCFPIGPGMKSWTFFQTPEIFTQRHYDGICIGKQPIFFIGLVIYDDMFSGKDTTRFCYKYIYPDTMLIWTNYNEIK